MFASVQSKIKTTLKNIFTHNGQEVTKAQAVASFGKDFVQMLIDENRKCLDKGYDIYNSELRLSKDNRLNVRSSYSGALLSVR